MAAAPVLVRAYTGVTGTSLSAPSGVRDDRTAVQALPPVSSYAFADILRSADGPDFQNAIDGIAEICAKNRMSLAEEYASHMPPVGEITATSSVPAPRSHTHRPGMRRALTSVPEASSSSSEGSGSSKKRKHMFSFRRQEVADGAVLRKIRIGSMGRTISVSSSIAITSNVQWPSDAVAATAVDSTARPGLPQRTPSEATLSLQRLLGPGRDAHLAQRT